VSIREEEVRNRHMSFSSLLQQGESRVSRLLEDKKEELHRVRESLHRKVLASDAVRSSRVHWWNTRR